jgi:hypothetical protein
MRDFAFSLPWIFAFPAIAVPAAALPFILKLHKRYPKLNRFLFARKAPPRMGPPLSREEQQKQYDEALYKYQTSAMRLRPMLLSLPAEDGLICVPIILVGISPMAAIVGGLAFGLLHIGGRTVLDCAVKVLVYSLLCLIVLPHGLLTVVAGHMINNLIGVLVFKTSQRFE